MIEFINIKNIFGILIYSLYICDRKELKNYLTIKNQYNDKRKY